MLASMILISLFFFYGPDHALFICVLLFNGLAVVVENQPGILPFGEEPKEAQAEHAKAVGGNPDGLDQ